MPFIKQSRRDAIDAHGLGVLYEIQPGDVCYQYYKPMVDAWKKEPRWTTAHNILREVNYALVHEPNRDYHTARSLAWMVFFQLYIMPYELEKRKENGDI